MVLPDRKTRRLVFSRRSPLCDTCRYNYLVAPLVSLPVPFPCCDGSGPSAHVQTP